MSLLRFFYGQELADGTVNMMGGLLRGGDGMSRLPAMRLSRALRVMTSIPVIS